jgi:two-component system response regulator FixJ
MQTRNGFIVHVIDDDKAVCDSLKALLEASGFDAETYNSATDFLARTPSDRGCLLLDISMPGMSGLDLMQYLADQGRRTPIVVLTANLDERIRQRAHQLGAAAYLTKPVTEKDLLSAILDAKSEYKGTSL